MFLIIVQIISVSETRSREHTRISIKLITIFYLVYICVYYYVITMISNLINYTNIIIATNTITCDRRELSESSGFNSQDMHATS